MFSPPPIVGVMNTYLVTINIQTHVFFTRLTFTSITLMGPKIKERALPLHCSKQCSKMILSISGRDPSGSKSNQLHVEIFRFFFINLKYSL